VFLGLWTGVHPQRLLSCLQGRPLHRSIDAACVLKKTGNEKHAYFHKSGGKIKERKIKLIKHVFALYSLPVIFFTNFLARYARSIAFYPPLRHASMPYALPTPFIFFFILVLLSLTASFQNSLKTRIKLHKIAYKMSKRCLRGWERTSGEGEDLRMGGRAPWLLGG